MAILLDSGILYAFYDRSDRWHEAAAGLIQAEAGALLLPAPVVPEVDHLLGVRLGSAARADNPCRDGVVAPRSGRIDAAGGRSAPSRCGGALRAFGNGPTRTIRGIGADIGRDLASGGTAALTARSPSSSQILLPIALIVRSA